METVHSLRIDHGPVQANAMSYPQRQPPTHRPNHNQPTELYKPSRSPLANSQRYPYPVSPHLQTTVSQVSNQQRYNVPPTPTFPPAGYRDYRQPRISLLHPEYSNRAREQLHQLHHIEPVPNQGQQPFKKMRLQDQKDEGTQPLRIDTRESTGAYNPQVEAISPTLPDNLQPDELPYRSSKDELLQQIGKVDREIAKADAQIIILKKKQQELEELALKPSTGSDTQEDFQPKHRSLAQKVYAENRKKAQNAHAKFDSLGPKVEFPLYNQPSDTPVYQENWKRHVLFKKRLLGYFKKSHLEKQQQNGTLMDQYGKLMHDWLKKVDKIESGVKRKAKEMKNREFFEKVFPELRKQREDKERFNRVGARVKSEADLEEIMDNLQEQALEDKKMRSYAVVPPILYDTKERKVNYWNTNGHIVNMEEKYKSRQFLNVWTPSEKETFKEKYLQHPKNFVVIASYIDRKSVCDCIQYYYLSKKTENYKQLLRKSRQRTRSSRTNAQKLTTGSASSSVVDILTTGVTTRLQREQQKTQSRDTTTTDTVTTTNATVATTSDAESPQSAPGGDSSPSSIPLTVAKSPAKNEVDGGEFDESVTSKQAEDESKSNVVEGELNKEAVEVPATEVETPKVVETIEENNVSSDHSTSSETKKKKERRKDLENNSVESSEDESSDVQDKPDLGKCAVCGTQIGSLLQSRPLLASNAQQYGLVEEQVPANGRVCNSCRCKSVRSRYVHCPLPNCPNSRGRVKRLRSFPQRLLDLPPDVRDPIFAEFHVPSGVTKCCSACFNRFQRHLGPAEEWPEDEIAKLKNVLTDVGANWQLIGERLVKPPQQVRAFYMANRKRLSLEMCLGDRKPALTDEEESGSSTSSCEEPMRNRLSSDTASAESPPVLAEQNHHQLPTVKKEDYDSSATETADEGQTPDVYGSATITVVNNDGQRQNTASPLTVKDLMLNVIEFSLMKNAGAQHTPQHPPVSGMAPTISSILNNDSNEVTIVSEYNLNNMQPPNRTTAGRNEISITKLVTPLIAATITPVPPSGQVPQPPPQELANRNDLVVFQVQDTREPETLDLSIKKPREPPPLPPAHAKLLHRPETSYNYHPDQRKSPAVYVSAVPRVQPKLPSPKPANLKSGSITLGTPIISQPRYEGLLRQMTPEPKMGSITQGTPIHVQDKRMYDYYNKRPPMPQHVVGQAQQPPGATYPTQYRQPSYSVEQQLSSRQIIMNDYITSQQMLGRRNEKPQYYASIRTPPPPPPQQRQGVIQRHTPRPLYPPGHEALGSLVDVAVQQPNLPVPNSPHEGLGKTMADNILEQPHRFHLMQQQQLRMQQQQQRLEAERRAYQQQQRQQTPRADSSTLTAACLIDAIITHTINQSADGTREVVTNNHEPSRPGDRLFQGFHREQPSDQQRHSPSIISVDLDGEPGSKNMTIKELAETVISHDFGGAAPRAGFYADGEWKRRLQKEDGRKPDERQIIRIAQQQQQKYQPVSPPEPNHHHWAEPNFRRYPQPAAAAPHISALDYVKNRIVEVMRTEDDKKEEKDRSDSPGDMVIDEEGFSYPSYGPAPGQHKPEMAVTGTEPKPLLSAQYEPLSDED